jgi:hypothetical protein
MKRILLFAPVIAAATFAACSMQTSSVTDVTYESAKVNYEATVNSGDGPGQYWIEYRKVGDSTWTSAPKHNYGRFDSTQTVQLSETLTNLDDSTQYEVRACGTGDQASPTTTGCWDHAGSDSDHNYDRFTTLAAPTVTADAVSQLRKTFGINTRTAFAGTNYDCWGGDVGINDCQRMKDELVYLGVDHIRDGIGDPSNPQQTFLDDLSATTNVKMTMDMSSLPEGIPFINEKLNQLDGDDTHETRLRNLVTAFEGVNEPDYYAWSSLCADGFDNDSWADQTRAANDNKADMADPECVMDDNNESQDGYQGGGNGCTDGQDNDGDGKVDLADPECDSGDESEKLAGEQLTPKWPERARQQQQYLFDRVNGDPRLATKPVIGISFAFNAEDQVGDMSGMVDYGNIHPYPGDQKPGYQGGSLDNILTRCKQFVGQKPCAATEFGYHTAINQSPNGGVSEKIQALYSLRLFMEHYVRHIYESDFYNMVEQWPDEGTCTADSDGELNTADWGWHNCQWTRNPVVESFHNLTQELGSGGSGGAFKAKVEQPPTDARVAYFRGSDGDVRVLVWRDVSNWNQNPPQTEAFPAAQDVTFNFPAASSVTKFVPRQDANGTNVPINNRRVTVPVAGDLVVLKVH